MVAFWLLPSAPARDFFQALIEDLAQRFDAPSFEPHLTLCSTRLLKAAQFQRLAKLTLPRIIELEIEGIECSETFTKTLFVQFKRSAELFRLRDDVANALGVNDDAELDPHLSLIYKKLPNERKIELARTIRIPFEVVRFEAIKAILTPSKVKGRAEVEAWRTIWERPVA